MGNQVHQQKPSVHCKIIGCQQPHQYHFCKFCRNNDSDHFAFSCPKKQLAKTKRKVQSCRVKNCPQSHLKHYCKVCGVEDVDHFASQCSEGIKLYHGTTIQAALSIKRSGFRPSADGCLGPGVYFTPSWEDAVKISQRWGDKASVIECKLDQDSDFVEGRMHPPWLGVTKGQFKEYVVKEGYINRIKIVKIHRV